MSLKPFSVLIVEQVSSVKTRRVRGQESILGWEEGVEVERACTFSSTMTLASLLFSCFPSRPATQPLLPTQPVPDPASPIKVRECVFCELTENGIAGPEKIRYEDGACVVFRGQYRRFLPLLFDKVLKLTLDCGALSLSDRSQGAEQHLLVIPKGHVGMRARPSCCTRLDL